MQPPALETTRLLLRPLAFEDAPAIQRLFPHWEIVRLMDGHIPWPYPPDGAETYLREVALPAAARGEAWHWTLRRKTEPETVIGVISLMDKEDDNRGFWLGLEWQGHGLMTEASDAVTDYWFEVLGKPRLRAPKAVENKASRRISERSGMRVVRTMRKQLVSGEHDSEVWEISAENWRERRNRPAKNSRS